jgi:hypothetical protein
VLLWSNTILKITSSIHQTFLPALLLPTSHTDIHFWIHWKHVLKYLSNIIIQIHIWKCFRLCVRGLGGFFNPWNARGGVYDAYKTSFYESTSSQAKWEHWPETFSAVYKYIEKDFMSLKCLASSSSASSA